MFSNLRMVANNTRGKVVWKLQNHIMIWRGLCVTERLHTLTIMRAEISDFVVKSQGPVCLASLLS